MTLTPELIFALSAFITAILAAIGSYISARQIEKRSSKKEEVDLLREEVDRLQKRVEALSTENEVWRNRYDAIHDDLLNLRLENAWLKFVLRQGGIDIPPMPDTFSALKNTDKDKE